MKTLLYFLLAAGLFAAPPEPTEKPFEEIPLPDGRYVLSLEGTFYRVRFANGEVQAIRAKTTATAENALDDIITNPAPPVLEPVPESVSRRQLLVALFMATGVKDTDILTSLGAIADPAARYVATVEFREAGEFRRAHPLIAQLAAQLSLSAEQVDDIFRAAAKL
jgi:hypothetical protein